ncbi:aromatic amino acid lyase [Streptomyces sp. NPDC051773]|uniref:aromatic amino acid lyase n=1 Tax=Streptomyces sp. NPDC051773 TaxID=3156682 RepID=UPI00341B2EB2
MWLVWQNGPTLCIRVARARHVGAGHALLVSAARACGAECHAVLAHLTCGRGEDLPSPAVRAMLLVRPASLSCGRSTVTPGVLDFLATVLRTDFAPAVAR